MKNLKTIVQEFEKAIADSSDSKFILSLYIVGMTTRSKKAIDNIKKICDEHLAGRYELEVIDLIESPELAKSEQITATPALVKQLPLPLRKLIGDMSNSEKFLAGIGLRPKSKREAAGKRNLAKSERSIK